jgi:hypothetical protein
MSWPKNGGLLKIDGVFLCDEAMDAWANSSREAESLLLPESARAAVVNLAREELTLLKGDAGFLSPASSEVNESAVRMNSV